MSKQRGQEERRRDMVACCPAAVSRCVSSLAGSASVSPRSPTGFSGPPGSGWTALIGPIAPLRAARRPDVQIPLWRIWFCRPGQTLALGDLGAITGADAIHQTLVEKGVDDIPSVRTINRISSAAAEHLTAVARGPAGPLRPTGWYLPDVARRPPGRTGQHRHCRGLLWSSKAGRTSEVLNAVSLHGGLTASWPVESPVTSELTNQSLYEHWGPVGLPA